jgi:hypothetical protein
VSQKINWLTCDIIIKKRLAQSIAFNEHLQSGQEFNYFSKLVHKSINGVFLDMVLTLRRDHKDSISSNLNDNQLHNTAIFYRHWYTFKDLKNIGSDDTLQHLIDVCIYRIYHGCILPTKDYVALSRDVFLLNRIKGLYTVLMLMSLHLFNRGYYFLRKALKY